MQIVIDIGNSLSKVGIFEKDVISELLTFKNLDENTICNILKKYPSIKTGIISTVSEKDVESILKKYIDKILVFSSSMKLPIKNSYKTPNTLGNDRLAGVIGAIDIFPNKDVLVIDAGSAITYDIITKNKEYLGGSISPGLNMRYKALHTFTGKLPLVTQKDEKIDIGDSTENAIVSGVQNGILYEVESYINKMKDKFPDIKIIITGGDAIFLQENLKKNSIFVEQNIVLKGLNSILQNNE